MFHDPKLRRRLKLENHVFPSCGTIQSTPVSAHRHRSARKTKTNYTAIRHGAAAHTLYFMTNGIAYNNITLGRSGAPSIIII